MTSLRHWPAGLLRASFKAAGPGFQISIPALRALAWLLVITALSACRNDLGERPYELSPSKGGKQGGTEVVVSGPLLSENTRVFFDGVVAPQAEFDDGRLRVLTPPHAVGEVDVEISEDIGVTTTLAGAFTYVGEIELLAVSPSAGRTRGGTEVVLSGAGFTRATRVSFGGELATTKTFVDDQTLRVVAPPHAEGAVNVVVSVAGEGQATLEDGFVYEVDPLEVKRFSPTSGPVEGGTEVLVAGKQFTNDVRVYFGDEPAATTEFVDETLLKATTPAASPGKVRIRVVSGERESVSVDEFTFTDAGNGTTAGVLPRIVSAASLDNRRVLVAFNEAMDEAAVDPANYQIAWSPTEAPAAAPLLLVLGAEFDTQGESGVDRSRVVLTTLSQSEVTYTLRVTGVRDLDGEAFTPITGSAAGLVDPSITKFAGTPPGGALEDADGDGLSDQDEARGHLVQVRLTNGSVTTRWATSDPYVSDTDADALDDAEERHLMSDPRAPDTDGDRLSDDMEYNHVFSDQNAQDSDGDAIDDYLEVSFFWTNPLLEDSDGDGFTDGEELFALARDPRIADLPEHEISVSEVTLQLDQRFSYVDESGRTVSDNISTSSVLRQSENTSFSRSSSQTHAFTLGAETSNRTGAKGGTEEGKPVLIMENSAEVKLTASTSHEWSLQTSAASARESESSSQAARERGLELSDTATVTREIVSARMDAAVGLRNISDVAFSLRNVELTVLAPDPNERARFTPLATLLPSSTLLTGEPASFTLGPLQSERGPVVFSNREVFPNLIDDLMQNPRGLVFRVANFELVDEDGREFTFKSQLAHDTTAALLFDYGDGTTERFLIATSGGLDADGNLVGGFDGSGKPVGIPLDFALQHILGLEKNRQEPDAILAGPNGSAQSIAQGDDVQQVPGGIDGLLEDTVIVSAGENGILDSTPEADDVVGVVSGYTTSATCAPDTPRLVIDGGNGRAETVAASDDVQVAAYGETGLDEDAVILEAGGNGFVDTAPGGDDRYVGPGQLCDGDEQCSGGRCSGREAIARFKHRQHGAFGRFWTVLTHDESPLGLDFGQIMLHPGQTLAFAFVQDLDRDGVIAQQEYLYGSSDTLQDTDGDGLDDYSEIRVGWEVGVLDGSPIRHVYPDPRFVDSDRDGLSDREEQDVRRVACECFGGETPGIACRVSADCAEGTCGNALPIGDRCSGEGCSPCPAESVRTNPRTKDSDADGIGDADEILGFLSGAGIAEPSAVIIAGPERTVQTLACPSDLCTGGIRSGEACRRDYDCPEGRCAATGCDDVQVVPLGALGLDPRTVVVGPGSDGVLDTTPLGDNLLVDVGDGLAQTRAVSDDRQIIAPGAAAAAGSATIKPGPNGVLDSVPTGDDVIFAGRWPRVTNPLNPDTDFDQIRDGAERTLGSDPTDALDSGSYSDRDADGLSDSEEGLFGWTVCVARDADDCADENEPNPDRTYRVYSNPNVSDSDLDGLPDYAERRLGTDPGRADTDGDGIEDFDDCSQDALLELVPYQAFFRNYLIDPAQSKQHGTSPTRSDTDFDGITDFAELNTEFHLAVPGETTVRRGFTSATQRDTDQDGLSDNQELTPLHARVSGEDLSIQTDPTDPDTDDDGRLDGNEVRLREGQLQALTNPLVPDIAVTVRWNAVDFESSVADEFEGVRVTRWGFRLGVMYPGSAPYPGDSQLMSWREDHCTSMGGGLYDIGACSFCIIPQGALAIPPPEFENTVTFALRQGQSFTLTGEFYVFPPEDQCQNTNGSDRFELPFTFDAVRPGGAAPGGDQPGAYVNTLELEGTGAEVIYDIATE